MENYFYCQKNTMEKAGSRARGDRLQGLYQICETQKTVGTVRLEGYVNALHESDKLDAIHLRDMALYMQRLETERDALKSQVAAFDNLLHTVANQYDGNDTTEWSIGANHVFKLFTKEICSIQNKLRQRAKQATGTWLKDSNTHCNGKAKGGE
ncbi:hypothetical protein JAO78_005370 [Alishewanella sp. 16-MA]|uniref:Uncharacterized protein n=1 Tax=Alishewanella maricola TaxID=2795740 RepID=A0ABS8C1M7_9ALTE|nr:hypothetical protein [Alishewanella maricola]MCB5226242.1 hypothetical protein [Alishewanella maricola]